MTVPHPLIIAALLACQGAAADADSANCVAETPQLRQMHEDTLLVPGGKPGPMELTVKVADDAFERAAGFQHICPEAVEETAILFRFEQDTQNAFHMRNCHAPLDIAFIDATGVVVDVQRMEPYVDSVLIVRQPLYRSRAPFRYALETAAGRMERIGIGAGTPLTLP